MIERGRCTQRRCYRETSEDFFIGALQGVVTGLLLKSFKAPLEPLSWIIIRMSLCWGSKAMILGRRLGAKILEKYEVLSWFKNVLVTMFGLCLFRRSSH